MGVMVRRAVSVSRSAHRTLSATEWRSFVRDRRWFRLLGWLAAGCHQEADLVLVGRAPIAFRDELAAIHDRDPVGHLEHLVELGGDEQHGGPRVALVDHLAMDELD